MAIAVGSYKNLVFKKQSGLGVPATGGAATGQLLRRVSSNLDKAKAGYQSKEILPSMQLRDFRHGVVSVAGTIAGELSVGTYQSFIESACRQLVQSAATSGALTDVTAAATAPQFVTAGGNFITSGFKVGMVIRWTGWATTGAVNNARNFYITTLTATQMSGVFLDGTVPGIKAAGDSVTALEVGKHTFIPQSAQTRDYYTIEHAFTDVVLSEYFTDCVIVDMNVKLPATGMATIDFPIKGLNMTTGTTAYFSSPTAASTGKILAAVNGAVYVNGLAVGIIKTIDFSLKGNHTVPGGIVGTNVDPDIYPGTAIVTGNMTVLFSTATLRDYFLNETVVAIGGVFTTDNTATAGFVSFMFPTCKINGAQKDDPSNAGLTMTMPFTSLENTAGGTGTSTVASSLFVQDSAFV